MHRRMARYLAMRPMITPFCQSTGQLHATGFSSRLHMALAKT